MDGKRYILDILVLTAVILLGSWVFRRSDPGWFEFQTSVWLILPLMVGGRYGFVPGLFASCVSAVVATAAQHFLTESDVRHLVGDHSAYYVTLLSTGALSGLVHRMRTGNRVDLEEQVKALTEEREILQANNRLYRENEAQLQSALVSHQVSFRSLTRDADMILQSSDPVEESLLRLLHEWFGLRSAGLYRAVSDTRYTGVSLLGEEGSEYPPNFEMNNAPALARIALEKGELATCRSLWEDGETDLKPQPFLAALPAPQHLLLIRDMQFESIDWENFAKMEAIFLYVVARASSKQKVTPSSAK